MPTGNIQIQEEFDRPAFWAVHLYQTDFTTAEGKEQGRIYGSPVADSWAGAAGCHKVPEHASGARRKLARLVGREGKGEEKNRSPKGNMWSAIPVALLCMIVNLCEGKQGSGPKGDEVL